MRTWHELEEGKLFTMISAFLTKAAAGLLETKAASMDEWVERAGGAESLWADVCREHNEEPTTPPYQFLMLTPPREVDGKIKASMN